LWCGGSSWWRRTRPISARRRAGSSVAPARCAGTRAGIAAGRGLGASACAALIARGFAELSRFGAAFGAEPSTLMGLSGLGDLVLTCGSAQSRNYAFGLALGRGTPMDEAMASGGLVEGAFTCAVLVSLAQSKGVDMPIASAVDAVLSQKLSIAEAIGALLARPAKPERLS